MLDIASGRIEGPNTFQTASTVVGSSCPYFLIWAPPAAATWHHVRAVK